MVLTKRLVIESRGKIKGGTISLSVDPVHGIVNYICDLTVGIMMFRKTFSYRGGYNVDPKLLLSENCRPGRTLAIGPVRIAVGDVGQKDVLAAVTHASLPDMKGQARISTKAKFIDVVSVAAQGQAFGQQIDLFAK